MESGTGASLPLLLHVMTAGIDHAWNIRNQSRNIRDSYPVRRIFGVVVVIVKGGGSSFQKVFFAAVVVFELNKGVVITEQLLQFFWRGSSTAVGVCAVLCIAILIGVIYSNGKLPIAWIYFVFYGNYLLPLRFSSFYLLPPGKNGYKKPTAYNALHVRWLLQPYFCFSVGSHLEDRITTI